MSHTYNIPVYSDYMSLPQLTDTFYFFVCYNNSSACNPVHKNRKYDYKTQNRFTQAYKHRIEISRKRFEYFSLIKLFIEYAMGKEIE